MQKFGITLLRDGQTKMTCAEANCDNWRNGWITVIDPLSEIGGRQANYIRRESGRGFVELPADDADPAWNVPAGMIVFKFFAGQACFGEHADREVILSHGRRVHTQPSEWTEDFNETAAKAAGG